MEFKLQASRSCQILAAALAAIVSYLFVAVFLSGPADGFAAAPPEPGVWSSLKAVARAHVGTSRGPYIAALICILAAVVVPFSMAFGKQLARRMLGSPSGVEAAKPAVGTEAAGFDGTGARLMAEADLAELEKSDAFQVAKVSQTLPADERCDIFLSHAWGSPEPGTDHRPLQRRAHLIAAALRQAGYTVWLDVERMSGSTTSSMCLGISMASAVVICFSNAYAESDNCQKEASHAVDAKKPLFFVNVGEKPDYDAKRAVDHADAESVKKRGWLSMLLGSQLWADARTIAAAASAGGIPKLLQSLAADERVHRTTKPVITTTATAASASTASLAALAPELLLATMASEAEASDPSSSPTASSPASAASPSASGIAEKAASKARGWLSSIRKAASSATESATAAVSASVASLTAQQPQPLMAVPAAPPPVPAGLAATLSSLAPVPRSATSSAAAAGPIAACTSALTNSVGEPSAVSRRASLASS